MKAAILLRDSSLLAQEFTDLLNDFIAAANLPPQRIYAWSILKNDRGLGIFYLEPGEEMPAPPDPEPAETTTGGTGDTGTETPPVKK